MNDWGHCHTCGIKGHPKDDLRTSDAICYSCKRNNMMQRIKRALNITWQQIGDDVLRIAQQMDGKPEVDQDEVVEMVLDADRPEMFGQDKEAIDEFNKLSYEEKVKFAKREVFKAKRYSW